MPRRQVPLVAGNYYHVYNRGNNRQLIFFERENYLFFWRQLRHHLLAHGTNVIAYCLMPNHYHLLVDLATDNFSNLMQAFSFSYTKAINKRYQRVGSVFQGRFQAIHVDREEYLLYLTRYIHLNPVRAKLVEKAEDWEFSSYPEYAGSRGGTLPQMDVVRSQLYSPDEYPLFMQADSPTEKLLLKHLTFDE